MLFTNLTFGKNAFLARYIETIELFSLWINKTPLPASHGNIFDDIVHSTDRVLGHELDKNSNFTLEYHQHCWCYGFSFSIKMFGIIRRKKWPDRFCVIDLEQKIFWKNPKNGSKFENL